MKFFDNVDKTMMLSVMLGTRMMNGEYVSRQEFGDMVRAHRTQNHI
ncbi:hypothetical protein [Butyricicoccus porcorum]|nr:hypothetical protein [Butyricicoccus porcorum]MCI6927283.1 hypothetical protein [Butyricicoccus porcorum]MDD6986579.1 hypothetical protein [Butyricicoccus porcorum]MDY4484058.1 hypothetical protein [Butyricicoccus porcorum]